MSTDESAPSTDFIRAAIDEHNRTGRFGGIVHTRFPPEPNGYLHIGHAKALSINFGIASEFGGQCNLRFDDTNPVKEDVEFVDSIMEDIRWLGFDWQDRLFYASDYFEQLYQWAEQLIRDGKAYVCDLSADEVRTYRGTLSEPGVDSPYRKRTVAENLDLFHRMRAGEFADGARTLRAKIDMASGNMNLRDPIMYRIIHEPAHHRTGHAWCIYPMYDWAHGQSDSIEGITHSLCSLEYEDHRPLYDWFLDALGIHHPQQFEFARLGINYTVMSKRKLKELVQGGYVRGWDDPRMPTLSGMRRRGYTPAAILDFCARNGVTKVPTTMDMQLLEHCVREELNRTSPRVMAVLNPVKLTIVNYPEGQVEWLEAQNNPEDESTGTRLLPFTRELYVEADDYLEDAPKRWFRMSPGREVRLKHAYFITCQEAIRDAAGKLIELRCTYDPESRGGGTPDGRVVRGTLHWVSAPHAADAEIRLYEHLFSTPDPDAAPEGAPEGAPAGAPEGGAESAPTDYKDNLNPTSEVVLTGCKVEPSLADAASGGAPGARFQFLRQGYFCADPDSAPGRPVYNQTVTLKDGWAKAVRKE